MFMYVMTSTSVQFAERLSEGLVIILSRLCIMADVAMIVIEGMLFPFASC